MDDEQVRVLRETASMVYYDRSGFALVQGPPGTGKTTFLRALLNVLHNAATQHLFENLLSTLSRRAAAAAPAAGGGSGAPEMSLLGSITDCMSRQEVGMAQPASTGAGAQYGAGASASIPVRPVRRGRILVCAQSNAALDELIARVLRLQFVDEFRNRYHADMVRIGSQPGEAVRAITLKERAADLAASALGLDHGRVHTPQEQATRRQQLRARLAKSEREQWELARRRQQHHTQREQLHNRLDTTAEPGAVDALRRQLRASNQQDGQMAQRLVALHTEMDDQRATLRSMDCVESHVQALGAKGAGAGAHGGAGASGAGSAGVSSDCGVCSRPSSRPSSPTAAAAAAPLDERRGGRPIDGTTASSAGAVARSAIGSLERSTQRLLESEVLERAHIVFCTLSGAGDLALQRLAEISGGFETAIFDEAAQAAELATLIPLQYGARRVVLVGDPQQLPATVLSLEAKRRGYDTSLFERLQRGGYPSHMLRTQYRMHPNIRRFPSAHFYEGALKDGERVLYAARVPVGAHEGAPGCLALPLPSPPEVRYAPLAFFNLLDGEQSRSSETHSLRNEREARFVARLLLALLHAADAWRLGVAAAAARAAALEAHEAAHEAGHSEAFSSTTPSVNVAAAAPPSMQPCMGSGCCLGPSAHCAFGGLCGRIAILTPYKEQCRTLEHELSAVLGPRAAWAHAVEVASVDTFQGKEKDVILFSSVRSGNATGLGFVKDLRRLNVALTRARHALYIVGHDASLRRSPDWNALLTSVRAHGWSRDVTLAMALRQRPSELLAATLPVSLLDGSQLVSCEDADAARYSQRCRAVPLHRRQVPTPR